MNGPTTWQPCLFYFSFSMCANEEFCNNSNAWKSLFFQVVFPVALRSPFKVKERETPCGGAGSRMRKNVLRALCCAVLDSQDVCPDKLHIHQGLPLGLLLRLPELELYRHIFPSPASIVVVVTLLQKKVYVGPALQLSPPFYHPSSLFFLKIRSGTLIALLSFSSPIFLDTLFSPEGHTRITGRKS